MIPGIFGGNKRRDMAQMDKLQSSDKPMSFVAKSNKLTNPMTGSKIAKGSLVRSFVKKGTNTSFTQSIKPELKMTPGSMKVEKKFVPGDWNHPGNPIINRKTTPEIGKQMHENPAKTQARMEAQAAGKTSYNYKDKEEYSGKNEMQTTHTPAKVDLKVKIDHGVKKEPYEQKNLSVSAPHNDHMKLKQGPAHTKDGYDYKRGVPSMGSINPQRKTGRGIISTIVQKLGNKSYNRPK